MKVSLKVDALKIFAFIAGLFFIADSALIIVIPLYLTKFGLKYAEIGGIFGAFGLGMAFVKILVGRHSDVIGRKIYLLITLLGSALVKVALIFAVTPVHFTVILAFDGLCRGLYSVVRAPLITELSPADKRGSAFGLVSGFSTLGATIGAALGGFLYSNDRQWLVFSILAIVLLIGACASYFAIPNTKAKQEESGKSLKLNDLFHIPAIIWILCLINLIQNVVTPPLWNMLVPIYLTKTLGLSAAFLGIVYSIDNLLGIPLSVSGGFLSDKFNAKYLFIFGSLIAGVVALSLMFTINVIIFVVVLLLFCGLFNLISPILERVESEAVRNGATGFDFGLISFAVSFGAVIGSFVIGKLMDVYGEKIGFLSLGIGYLSMAVIGLVGLLNKRSLAMTNETKGNLSE